MPTYEYECTKCGHLFEKFHAITAEPVKECPKCDGKVKRLIGTGVGLIFKGSGFYITDYKNNGKKSNVKNNSVGNSSGAKENQEKKSKKPEKGKNEKVNENKKSDTKK